MSASRHLRDGEDPVGSTVLSRDDGTAEVVRLAGIAKAYGATQANDGIDLTVAAGEVLGLVGGNGAGKSTLMRILCGLARPDAGTIAIGAAAVALDRYGAAAAHAAGIRMVHQELSLCGNLSVAENFFLEAPAAARLRPGWRRPFRDRARAALDAVFPGHGIDAAALVGDLPIGQRQMVEIARAAATPGLALLILDEPTSSLGLERSRQLQVFARARAAAGVAFIFISHKLREVLEIASRVMVLRNGRTAWSGAAHAASVPALVRLMGGDAETARRRLRPAARSGTPVLACLDGPVTAPLGRSVALRAGEVVGLAGLDGSGQKPALHRLFAAGRAAFVPGDRARDGLFPLWSVLANISIARIARQFPLRPISGRAERAVALAPAARLRLDRARLDAPILELSGGNQQKALAARALAADADIVLLDDPTRGVDVAAKADFYATVDAIAASGRLIVWHSTEDLEFLECDRVLVFSGGRIVRELAGPAITEAAIVDAAFAGAEVAGGAAAARPAPAQRLLRLAPFVSLAAVLGAMIWANPLTASAFGLDLLLGPALALVLVALGQMLVVGGSEIDLGIGAFAGLANVLSATVLVDRPMLGALALAGGLAGYGLVGAAIHRRRIPAIVATLGASFIWTGIGYSLQPAPGGSSPDWLAALFGWQLPGVPTSLLFIAAAAAAGRLIDRAPLGVVLRAFGGNPAAMLRSGWPPLRYAVIRYVLAGAFGLAAGLSLTAVNTASDVNAGAPFTLLSVAAVVMGGCALVGGVVSPLGAVAGALTLSLLGALLGTLGVSTDYNAAVQGLLLLAILVVRTIAAPREAEP